MSKDSYTREIGRLKKVGRGEAISRGSAGK